MVYGRVPRENVWGVLWEHGVDGCLLLAVKSPNSCSEDCVPVDGLNSQPFSVGAGLRQWCVQVSYILTTCPYFDNLEFDIFNAGGPQ